MRFESERKETILLNPREDMKRQTIPSEIRKDPLTGRTARICHFMKLKWDKPDFDELVARGGPFCPFCPENVLKVTPCFPEEIVAEGRMTRGDMVLFPNLAPYDTLGAVATLGSAHFIPMTEIEPERIVNGLALATDFFRRVEEIGHPEAVYHIVNWNYMPAAGSSLIHTHLQVFSTSSAPNLMRQELLAAEAYTAAKGTNFWDDLVAAEQRSGERFIGTIGRTAWMTAYAPMGVAGDVLTVVDGARTTLELTPVDMADIAEGLTRLMTAYDKMGIYSFNMNIFTGAAGDDFARLHLLFSPRTFFNQALGTPDIGALRNLFNETLCMAFPEEITQMLREDFRQA